MPDAEEIRLPDDPSRLIQHTPIDVLITVVTGQGEQRPVLGGRCSTPHLRPNGAIVVVKPQLPPNQMPPVKRSDAVHVRFRRSQNETLEVDGTVSWVRQKAFLPSGLAVSFVGITFGWDAEDRALEVAAFLARQSLLPPA
jgi:hypothetical protein